MRKKLLFIYHAKSGRSSFVSKLHELIKTFTGAGYDVIAHPTMFSGDAKAIAASFAESVDLIVAAGGDGTVNETVSGIISSGCDVPFGVIPIGSTNDFANTHRIPRPVLNAAENIIYGKPKKVDTGWFLDSTFIYIAGFGLFTDISYDTDQGLKNVFGYGAYLFEAGKRVFNVPNLRLKVTTENDAWEEDFIYGMVSNSHCVAGVKNLPGKDVVLDDGKLDVTLIRPPRNPLELGETLACLHTGEEMSRIIRLKEERITFESEKKIPWTIDGEDGGVHQRVDIKVNPLSITLITGGFDENMKEETDGKAN